MRIRTLLALLALLLVAVPATAAPPPPLVEYSKTTFTAAQAANLPIVVFVHAGWCITCRQQQPIVQQLASDAAFTKQKLIVFVVDYADKATLQELNVTDRSTLVAYRGRAERARSSFETDAAAIRALFQRAL
ncbi:MAG TPA: thioredoxin family protein [Methylomirabilota bacterium]|nr:thioredoxin family protein [Methylomirabilota bacterium]